MLMRVRFAWMISPNRKPYLVRLHSFCRECLKKKRAYESERWSVSLPQCQTQMAFAEGNRFDQLPTSFLHSSLLSLLPVQQSAIVVGSAADFVTKERRNKLTYCFDCEKFLCSHCVVDCVNAHELFRDDAHQTVSSIRLGSFPKAKEILHRKAPRERSKQILLSHLPNFYLSNILNMNHKTHEIKLLETAAGH